MRKFSHRRAQSVGQCLAAIFLVQLHSPARAEVDKSGKPTAFLYGVAGIIPGFGQAVHGDFGEGALWAAPILTGQFAGQNMESQGRKSGADFLTNTSFKLWMYSVYDAYKDGGEFRGKSFAKLKWYEDYLAGYDLRHLRRLGVIIPLAVVTASSWKLKKYEGKDKRPHSVFGTHFRNEAQGLPAAVGASWLDMSFTGFGEEGLFRGFIQHDLTRATHPILGIPLASVLFAAAHTQYGLTQKAVVAAAGLYLGTLAHADDYDLRSAIFVHTMWDTILAIQKWRAGEPVGFNLQLPTVRF